MKKICLLMFVSVMLVTLGVAQTPATGGNTDPVNVQGCLGGSDGNYTVAEDGTGQIFTITASSVDLKPHLGHDVKLAGSKASATAGSGAADNSFAVTELNMVSEHCAGAAATPVAPAATVSAPPVDAAPPAATAATVSTTPVEPAAPAADAAAPAAIPSPSSATVSTPVVAPPAPPAPPAPDAAVSQYSDTVSPPAVEAAQPRPRSAHPRKLPEAQAAADTVPAVTVTPSSDAVNPPAAETPAPAATAGAVSTPAAAATAPAVTHSGGSLWLLVLFIVVVMVLGTLVPFFGRWRKRKLLERTGAPNLSFTNEAIPSEDEPEKPQPRKVA